MSIVSRAMSYRKTGIICTLFVVGAVLLLFDPFGEPLRPTGRRLTQGDTDDDLPVLSPLEKDQESPYRPIFMLHGLGSNHYAWTNMLIFLGKSHPETVVFPIAMFEDRPDSLVALEQQVKKVAEFVRIAIAYHPKLFSKGYHFLCHSQGALTCRAVVQYMDDHRVHTLISLAGPQMGVYGPNYLNVIKDVPILEHWTYHNIYQVAYAAMAQATLSIANMWNDPMHWDLFLLENKFLAKYNGFLPDNDGNARRKSNFVRLKKAVFLIGNINGPGGTDWSIEPTISGVWGFFKIGDVGKVVPMELQDIYNADLIGLKTLHQSGRLVNDMVDGVAHSQWLNDENLVKQYIIPHLD